MVAAATTETLPATNLVDPGRKRDRVRFVVGSRSGGQRRRSSAGLAVR
nr:hypothetical protein [Kibdelosporangium sp. MJ126-NF4]CTQ99150.1 hypothetical protein [Kibdelosporangium sp. MJ126-NF4]